MGQGRLTTHVLDSAQGKPAAGLTIDVCRVDDGVGVVLKQVRTNADGRTDEPALSGDAFTAGVYELRLGLSQITT